MFSVIIVIIVSFIAGLANVIAGAGSLLTFPALLSVGLPPVVANVTNDLGITAGNISGVWGIRRELSGQGHELLRLIIPVMIGSILGAGLLLLLPGHIFEWFAPFMLLVASLLTLAKSWVMSHNQFLEKIPHAYGLTIFLISTYGGYFGAGIGLLYMAGLTIFQAGRTQKLNAYKNVLQLTANGVAGLIFAFSGRVDWVMVLIMAVGTLTGAQLGSRISQRISSNMLRIVIASIGVAAAVALFVENFI